MRGCARGVRSNVCTTKSVCPRAQRTRRAPLHPATPMPTSTASGTMMSTASAPSMNRCSTAGANPSRAAPIGTSRIAIAVIAQPPLNSRCPPTCPATCAPSGSGRATRIHAPPAALTGASSGFASESMPTAPTASQGCAAQLPSTRCTRPVRPTPGSTKRSAPLARAPTSTLTDTVDSDCAAGRYTKPLTAARAVPLRSASGSTIADYQPGTTNTAPASVAAASLADDPMARSSMPSPSMSSPPAPPVPR